jgi:predicted secreted hydrolase
MPKPTLLASFFRLSFLMTSIICLLSMADQMAKADNPEPQIQIPQDEAPHQLELEWWYFTGHLSGPDKFGKIHQYGYELTFFQNLVPGHAPVYEGNLAITDVTANSFQFDQKIAAQPVPDEKSGYNLNISTWHMDGINGSASLAAQFSNGSYSFQLKQSPIVPVVLEGNGGVIPFGPFGTSFYYTWPYLFSFGTVTDHGNPVEVTGQSWMDHQWYTPPTHAGGWNWFSVQLDSFTQYMLFFIQDGSGQIAQVIATEVKDGTTIHLPAASVSETVTGSWTSPVTGFTYPQGWKLKVPGGQLEISPLQKDQELVVSESSKGAYWEGDSSVSGTIDGRHVSGVGYTEINPFTAGNNVVKFNH